MKQLSLLLLNFSFLAREYDFSLERKQRQGWVRVCCISRSQGPSERAKRGRGRAQVATYVRKCIFSCLSWAVGWKGKGRPHPWPAETWHTDDCERGGQTATICLRRGFYQTPSGQGVSSTEGDYLVHCPYWDTFESAWDTVNSYSV